MKQEEPKQHVEFINNNIDQLDKAIESFKQETLEEAAVKWIEKKYKQESLSFLDCIEFGAKWQQEQIGNSEVIQRIRASKSDAEARRIIRTT
jgi:two-component SAPR family response regulator